MIYLTIETPQVASQSFSLSPRLQEFVAYATIISASAVIIYIIQLIVTTILLKKQLDSNILQFKTLNQGFLSFELKVASTTSQPIKNQDVNPLQKIFTGVGLEGHMTNVGNMPVKCTIETFTMTVNNPQASVQDGPHSVVMTIYPKQLVHVTFPVLLFPNNQLYNYPEIDAMGITGIVKCSYTDFNDNKIKTINRQFLINRNNLALDSVYTAVNDTV